MTSEPTDHPPFEWIGGSTCLDFVNTVSWNQFPRDHERLGSYGDLLEWADRTGVLDSAEVRQLRRAGKAESAAGDAALERAHRLREAIHEVLLARAEARDPDPRLADAFNRFLAEALGRLRLEVGAAECVWVFADQPDGPDRVLWPVAWSAAQLLTSPDAQLLRRCAAERCGWLFLDRSRNRSRRWCDMKACGNSEKARRFYARKRKTA